MRFRNLLPSLLLFLCAACAFAADSAVVNIPFSFESHGQILPASQYQVRLSDDRHFLTMSSMQTQAKTMHFVAAETETNSYAPTLSIRFEEAGGLHELRSIRLGSYEYRY